MTDGKNPSSYSPNNEGKAETRIEITRRFYFSAGHRYYIRDLSPEENRKLFGDCVNPHGHNYVLEVSLSGPLDPRTGMIINLTEVKNRVNQVLFRYDHRFLNDDHPAFASRIPTTEMIALTLAEEIAPLLPPPCKLTRVRLYETEDLFAEVELL